jgi:hypothetical protein
MSNLEEMETMMKLRTTLNTLVLVACSLVALVACGGSAPAAPATLADIPTYTGAKALQPGENPMADTLAKNVQQSAAMGSKLEQKIFSLPKDADWAAIKSFYTEKLTAAGWANTNVPVPDNDMFKMTLWKKGTQNLTVAQLTEPISNDTFLLFSLSSQ